MSSLVQLGGVLFDLDPTTYDPLDGVRRGSTHPLIDAAADGSVTVFQDRGFNASDIRLTLMGQIADVTVLEALFALYRLRGVTHDFYDFKGNHFTVVFTPGAQSFKASVIRGSSVGWEYTMLLSVVSVVSWFNGAFPPSSSS